MVEHLLHTDGQLHFPLPLPDLFRTGDIETSWEQQATRRKITKHGCSALADDGQPGTKFFARGGTSAMSAMTKRAMCASVETLSVISRLEGLSKPKSTGG